MLLLLSVPIHSVILFPINGFALDKVEYKRMVKHVVKAKRWKTLPILERLKCALHVENFALQILDKRLDLIERVFMSIFLANHELFGCSISLALVLLCFEHGIVTFEGVCYFVQNVG